MKAMVCAALGSADDLELRELDDLTPGPGQLLIRVRTAGVNFPDNLMIAGKYQERPELPFVPGLELAGEVLATGDGVTGFEPGQRIAAATGVGAYAEQALVDAEHAIPIPDSVDDSAAAGLLVVYGTSIHALRQRADLKAGETLLVLGAAGGVGLSAVQLGKVMGARVIAAASTADKLEVARANGADELIDYGDGELKEKVKALTGGRGADVIYDPVGGDLFDQSTRCINFNGRLLVIGFASGRIPQFPVNLALVKGFSVVGVFWGRFSKKEQPELHRENMQQLFDWMAQGKFELAIDREYPLAELPAALNRIAARQATGKIIIRVP
ncbi:MAG: NADPH:quinone oxidoreductase [Thiotrichales bacterium]|mgnify:CR=1 FL=1|nr:NADPH:quinone oxidoreductase [Thiotrichales bacterium]